MELHSLRDARKLRLQFLGQLVADPAFIDSQGANVRVHPFHDFSFLLREWLAFKDFDFPRPDDIVPQFHRPNDRPIVRASDIDVVYLAGYGFPRQRGGPMFHADTLGLYNVVRSMRRFAANPNADPAFWEPAPLVARLAAEGRAFNSQ